ncbi:MAG: helix-turn-helix transcriptional regulator [Actinobacteria bacterium]|nr:helix-turn-helix transcriptional regulator [Actinomycetota bacterium]
MRTEPVLPKRFLRACVLLLLREQPSHGYELLERLATFGYERSDPGGLYRTLRGLEQEGLVDSAWEPSRTGPERRIYQVTRAGTEELHRQARELASVQAGLDVFLSRYGEFAALRGDAGSSPSPSPSRTSSRRS